MRVLDSRYSREVTVFVSYSRAQFYLAEDLALALRQRGVDAWLDVDRLEPGDDCLFEEFLASTTNDKGLQRRWTGRSMEPVFVASEAIC